ncbi:hypothetical protein QBC44DRAFT_132813 [Cladorrhinum sp. PSN332]|nr:hypothetical protein QBC44DRAFT_132813 [Cladorrhinum sp. PSN332]
MDHFPQQILYPDPHTPIQGDLQVGSMQQSPEQLCQQQLKRLFSKMENMEKNLETQIQNVQCGQCAKREHRADGSSQIRHRLCECCKNVKKALISLRQRVVSLIKCRPSDEGDSVAGTEDAGQRILGWLKCSEVQIGRLDIESMLDECDPRSSGIRKPIAQLQSAREPDSWLGYYELPGAFEPLSYDYGKNMIAELEQQCLPVELASGPHRFLQHNQGTTTSHTARRTLTLLTQPTTTITNESLVVSPQSSGAVPSPSFTTPGQSGPLTTESFTESPTEGLSYETTFIHQTPSGSRTRRFGTGDSWASSASTLVAHEESNNAYSGATFSTAHWPKTHHHLAVPLKSIPSFYATEYSGVSVPAIGPVPKVSSPPFGPDDFPKHPVDYRSTWPVSNSEQVISSGIAEHEIRPHGERNRKGAGYDAFFSVQLSPDNGQITGLSGKDRFHETRLKLTTHAMSYPSFHDPLIPVSQPNIRKDSWDSASTIIGPTVTGHQFHSAARESDLDVPFLQQPTLGRVAGRPIKTKQTKTTRKIAQVQVPTKCQPCDFQPAPGPDQRKKMERHMKTARHRKNFGEKEKNPEKFQCKKCRKTFNRRDNFRQHTKRCRHRAFESEGFEGAGSVEDGDFEAETQQATWSSNLVIRGCEEVYGGAHLGFGRAAEPVEEEEAVATIPISFF